MRENHKAGRNGTTAKWDRLTKRAILHRVWNSGRATNSERMPLGGNVHGKQHNRMGLHHGRVGVWTKRIISQMFRQP
jgi:hypothetical protein